MVLAGILSDGAGGRVKNLESGGPFLIFQDPYDSLPHFMRIAVLQPSYLPWLGYFDQIARVDAFVFYDDVQYDKDGWRNRNRIKTDSAEHWQWLTVPVLLKGKHGAKIHEVEINNTEHWRRKHLSAITQWYRRAPFFKELNGFFEEFYAREWKSLSDLATTSIREICGLMGIATPLHFSSKLGVTGEKVSRLVRLCEHFGADEYLTGDAAEDYLEPQAFAEKNIRIVYQRYKHPEYPQLYGPFLSHLSVVDVLFNCGPSSSLKVLCNEPRTAPGAA
jgi:hypothetical protein